MEIFIIVLCSVIQSLFGVGLLVFGTPSFMLLGYSFAETLSIVLPSSLIISLFQLLSPGKINPQFRNKFLLFFFPMMWIVLYPYLARKFEISIKNIIFVILMISPIAKYLFQKPFKKLFHSSGFSSLYFLVIGAVHGISNLGGGFLSLYLNTTVQSKIDHRKSIAFSYVFLAITQYICMWLATDHVSMPDLTLVFISGIIFLMVQRFLFQKVPKEVFSKIIDLFIFSYGVIGLIFSK
jgi:uncharacterized membrane protein YfcA